MLEFCKSKCQSAGFCCNDPQVGSNQMVSCAQACMMRARGSSWQELATEKDGLCTRSGSSGCGLTVKGRRYSFCSSCSDLTANPLCQWGVASSEACDFGASLTPSPEDYCSFSCKAAGYCCNDISVGSNQMISCAQACMMRTRGTSHSTMPAGEGGLCARTGSSGCSLAVGDRQYTFCSTCADLTDSPKCQWGVSSSGACDHGAAIPPSHWGM